MNDAVFTLGSISIYGFGLLATLAFLWGSFVFYKKAIESHLEEFQILDGVVMSAFWAFIMGRLSYVVSNLSTFWGHFPRIFLFSNFPGIEKWGVVAGVYLGIFLTVRRFKAKSMDWFDIVSLGILASSSLFYAGLSLLTYSWQFGVLGVLYLVFFVLGWDAESKYRTYDWYKSNKTSAKSGLITGLSLSAGGGLYLVEQLMLSRFGLLVCLWGVFLFVGGLVLVYIRSGRTVTEDIKIVLKHGRK